MTVFWHEISTNVFVFDSYFDMKTQFDSPKEIVFHSEAFFRLPGWMCTYSHFMTRVCRHIPSFLWYQYFKNESKAATRPKSNQSIHAPIWAISKKLQFNQYVVLCHYLRIISYGQCSRLVSYLEVGLIRRKWNWDIFQNYGVNNIPLISIVKRRYSNLISHLWRLLLPKPLTQAAGELDVCT